MTTNFFDGRKVQLIEEYKETKPNLLEEFKGLREGSRLPSDEVLFPLINWCSNDKKTILDISFLATRFFYIDKNITKHRLWQIIAGKGYFIKYPSSKKEEGELDWLIPYICRYYGWTSEREYFLYKDFINLKDETLHKTLHKSFGFEPSECRKLGLEVVKVKAKFEGAPRVKGFF